MLTNGIETHLKDEIHKWASTGARRGGIIAVGASVPLLLAADYFGSPPLKRVATGIGATGVAAIAASGEMQPQNSPDSL